MLPYYKTVKKAGNKEIVIRRSRFIGHVKPVQTEEEAQEFIAEVNAEHSMATHNCYAYVVGERDQFQKQSDDGEPSGTAGKPILDVIKHRELKNIAIVVTRYFGGVMLGAGGLIRAYSDGAVAAIEAGEEIYQVLHQEVKVNIDYTWLGKVENELHGRGVLLEPIEYTDQVVVPCLPKASDTEQFVAWMTDLTQGQATITLGEQKYIVHTELHTELD